jgi:hypothetical protein
MRKMFFSLFIAVVVALIVGSAGSSLFVQSLDDTGAAAPGWAMGQEPPMVKTEGTLQNPEGISVHLGNGTVIRGSEAVHFLLTNRYLEYDPQGRLHPTDKYKAWKKESESRVPEGVFRLSGGTDKQYVQRKEQEAARTTATFKIKEYSVSLEFVPDPSNPGSGRLVMIPATIEHFWEYRYPPAMNLVDTESATCTLKEGSFKVLTPNDPKNMIGNWGGSLNCHKVSKKNGIITEDAPNVDIRMQINYEGNQAWKVVLVGLTYGQWLLQ